MNESQDTLMEMLAEIAPVRIQEGDLTIAQVKKEFGFSEHAARDLLDRLVAEGKAVRLDGYNDNKRMCHIWRKV